MSKAAGIKGIVWGLIGGFTGTLTMDLIITGLFYLMGMPADLTFSFTGDVAAGFFSRIGIDLAGGVLLGAVMHYLIGLGLGGLFGAATSRINVLRVDTLKKGIMLGVLYTEIASQPILVTAPRFREMTVSDTLQWFSLSFVMHLIYGILLGAVMRYGLRFSIVAKER